MAMSQQPSYSYTYSYSYYPTSSVEEETNIKPVSCTGAFCYTIGGFVGQEFSRMEKPTKRKWHNSAPKWREATGGLNLEGNKYSIRHFSNYIILYFIFLLT